MGNPSAWKLVAAPMVGGGKVATSPQIGCGVQLLSKVFVGTSCAVSSVWGVNLLCLSLGGAFFI